MFGGITFKEKVTKDGINISINKVPCIWSLNTTLLYCDDARITEGQSELKREIIWKFRRYAKNFNK